MVRLVDLRLFAGARWSTQQGRVYFQEPRVDAKQPRRSWLLEYYIEPGCPNGDIWKACVSADELVIGRKYRLRRGCEVKTLGEVLARSGALPAEEGGKRA
jgi:hypothetical protein